MSTLSRRIGVLAGVAVLALAGGGAVLLTQLKAPPPRKAEIDQTKIVDTLRVQNRTLSAPLAIQGELVAFDKIDVFSEVSGTLVETARPFKEGSYFPKGSVLIKVDPKEAQLNLFSQKSNLLNAITQLMPDLKIDYPESYRQYLDYIERFELEKPIPSLPEPASKQEKFFIASRNIYAQYYTIKSAEERLSKYILHAPFSGVVTEAGINPGALVRSGQKLGELMRTGNYELEATVPVRELSYIKPGFAVELRSDDLPGKWTGKVVRISDQVDPGTQTVKVFIGVSGKSLREGMYLKGSISGSRIPDAMVIPKNILEDQKSVYLVQDSVLRKREVQVIKEDAERVIVRGLKNGEAVLATRLPDAFDGMSVRIRSRGEADTARQGNKPETGAVGSLQ